MSQIVGQRDRDVSIGFLYDVNSHTFTDIVYPGAERFPVGQNIEAIGLTELMSELRRLR